MKQTIFNNIKNIYGWKTNRKIIVISVDDYGNVRLDSKLARENLDKAGLKVYNRFDAYDTLETKADLEMLFETLSSVRDRNGRHAVFTPFALPCNIDFERIEEEKFSEFKYETLPVTYAKLSAKDSKAYEGTWDLWKEGIDKGLMKPQFHGREHLNLKVFEEKLAKKDFEVISALKNRSYTSISNSGYPTIKYTAAFDFWNPIENTELKIILMDGLIQFEKVFGYSAKNFMPPTSKIDKRLLKSASNAGINYVDSGLIHKQHVGFGKYEIDINFTGRENKNGQIIFVRNVVFEPTSKTTIDSVSLALKQIEVAFFWNKPAVISSHRVNFCGHIDKKNRKVGIESLNSLLIKIIKKWPDVEFMSADELGAEISKTDGKFNF